jgi:hypothetical protein
MALVWLLSAYIVIGIVESLFALMARATRAREGGTARKAGEGPA